MATFSFDPASSRLDVHASSSLHGIDTGADGVTGELELTLDADGALDLAAPVQAEILFPLGRLRSGNPLEDVATERAIELSRYPEVVGRLTAIELAGRADGPADGVGYRVTGELTFHGVTRTVEGEIRLAVVADPTDGAVRVRLTGEQTLDVRDWGVKPPRLGLLKVHPDIRVRLDAVATTAAAPS